MKKIYYISINIVLALLICTYQSPISNPRISDIVPMSFMVIGCLLGAYAICIIFSTIFWLFSRDKSKVLTNSNRNVTILLSVLVFGEYILPMLKRA